MPSEEEEPKMSDINIWLDGALQYFSQKILHMSKHQALSIASAQKCHLFSLASMNRNIDKDWVKKIKQEILEMKRKEFLTEIVVCIIIDDIKSCIREKDARVNFQAMIIDGQHRVEAMKELCLEDPNFDYEFFLKVIICDNEKHMFEQFKNINNRREITESQNDQPLARLKFVQAFENCTVNCNSRNCIRKTKEHVVLREDEVTEALGKLAIHEIEKAIKDMAKKYKVKFDNSKDISKTSVVYKTIQATKLYQLMDWEKGDWIKEMLRVG